jgi:lipopolysaccharide export system protein LptA
MHLPVANKNHFIRFNLSRKIRAGIAISGLLISGLSFALPSDRNQQIELNADRATYNQKSGVTTYEGNVTIKQGTVQIQANSLVAQLNPKTNEIQTITAKGSPAKFQQQISADKGIARGEGQTVVYNADTGIVTLTGNAYLSQDGASFRGNVLRYSMNAGDVEALGDRTRRVQLIIPPSTVQTQDKVKNQ